MRLGGPWTDIYQADNCATFGHLASTKAQSNYYIFFLSVLCVLIRVGDPAGVSRLTHHNNLVKLTTQQCKHFFSVIPKALHELLLACLLLIL